MRKICLRCGAKYGSQADFCPHDGTRLVTDDEVPDALIGSVLLEQFRVDALIGTGGMGTVYRARQMTIGRDVAIKVLRLELAREQSSVSRFEREARLASSLDHPNLVRVFLSGRLGDGRLYIVMELLEGCSLADELDANGPPSLERGLIMLIKLCAGLDAVHAKGIVHRDIKPENVYLVTRDGDEDFVKLVDFGISLALDTDSIGTESQSERVFGTAPYISPEAATGDPADRRSDIYSVGVLAYQLLTGELPFEGATAGAVLMQHVHDPPPPMHTKGIGAEVPAGIAQVVLRALEKDPADRFQTVAAFVDALVGSAVEAGLLLDARPLLLGTVWGDALAAPGTALADLLSVSSVPVSSQAAPRSRRPEPDEDALLSSAPAPFESSSSQISDDDLRLPRRRRWGWSFGFLLVAAVGVLGGVWWLRQNIPAPVPSPAHESPPAGTAADVRTGRTVVETPAVIELPPEPPPESPVLEEPSAEVAPAPPTTKSPEPRTEVDRPRRSPAKQPKASALPGITVPATVAKANHVDDGIDWTVPGFSNDELEQAGPSSAPDPTGTPNVPADNPIVIDEVPTRELR